MITLEPGDLLIEKDGSFAILLKRDDSLGVGAWKVIWNDGKTDMLPWVETSIKAEIYDGLLKHIKGGN